MISLKNKYIKKIIQLFIFIGAMECIFADSLSLDEFISYVVAKHPFLKSELINKKIILEEKKGLRGAEDWLLNIESNVRHDEASINHSGFEKQRLFHFGSSFNRKIWKTGGEINCYLYTENIDRDIGYTDSFAYSKAAINYVHSLNKNKYGFLDKLQYNLKTFETDIAVLEEKENIEEFLLLMTSTYLEWAYAEELRKIFLHRLDLSLIELEETRKKYKKNIVDRVELIRSEDYVKTSRQNLLLISSEAKALKGKISVIMGNDNYSDYSADFKFYEFNDVEFRENISATDFRSVKLLDERLNYLSLLKKGYEENLKASVSLIAEVSANNEDSNSVKSFSLNRPGAFIGIEYNRYLKQRSEKSELRRVNLEIEQVEQAKDSLVIDITSEIAYMKTLIKSFSEIFKLNQEQIELAHEKTDEEMKIYQQGRGDFTFVLQSRDNEQNAKLTYAENALKYHKLIHQYKALIDNLYIEK